MGNAAKTVLGYEKPPHDKPWYGEVYRTITDENNAGRMVMLQSVATRAVTERYKVKRRENSLFQRKNRQCKNRESEQIECNKRSPKILPNSQQPRARQWFGVPHM